jgi:hypothetical protein
MQHFEHQELNNPIAVGEYRLRDAERNPWRSEVDGNTERETSSDNFDGKRDEGPVNRTRKAPSGTEEQLDNHQNTRAPSTYGDGLLSSKVSFDRYHDDGVEIEGEHLAPLPLPPTRQNSDRSTPSQKKVLMKLKQQQEQGRSVRKVVNYATAIQTTTS